MVVLSGSAQWSLLSPVPRTEMFLHLLLCGGDEFLHQNSPVRMFSLPAAHGGQWVDELFFLTRAYGRHTALWSLCLGAVLACLHTSRWGWETKEVQGAASSQICWEPLLPGI